MQHRDETRLLLGVFGDSSGLDFGWHILSYSRQTPKTVHGFLSRSHPTEEGFSLSEARSHILELKQVLAIRAQL